MRTMVMIVAAVVGAGIFMIGIAAVGRVLWTKEKNERGPIYVQVTGAHSQLSG